MVKFLCLYLFSSLRNKEANNGEPFEKGSNFDQREHEYANTWGGGGRARGQNSLQNHFSCFLSVYI